MDTKGRLSVPAGFRTELQRRSEKAPILTNAGDHLALYPADVWEQKERELLEYSEMQPDVQDYQRYMVADAVDVPLDAQLGVPQLNEHEPDELQKTSKVEVGRDGLHGAGDVPAERQENELHAMRLRAIHQPKAMQDTNKM